MLKLNVFNTYQVKTSTLKNLGDIVEMIRSDEWVKEATENFRATGDDKMKRNMPCFAPACELLPTGKTKSHAVKATGLSLCDFDKLPPEDVERLRQIVTGDPHTLLAYVTVSGKGLRVIFAYEADTEADFEKQCETYLAAFRFGNAYYCKLLGDVESDEKCKDFTRLSGMAHDENVYYNPEAVAFSASDIREMEKKRVTKRRKARSVATVEKIYEKVILPELSKKGVVFEPGRHNDFIMRMGYLFNQYGAPLEKVVEWSVSRFGELYAETEQVVRSCYNRVEEHGIMKYEEKGAKWMRPNEIWDYLQGRYEFRRNRVLLRTECRRVAPEGKEPYEWRFVTDRIINTIWMEINEEMNATTFDINKVVNSEYIEEYCPFKSYLESLPKWRKRGADHIAKLARTVTVKGGEEKQKLFEKCLKKWLVAMVAGWCEDEVCNHEVLVIIGAQGIYKSTWMVGLMPPELKKYTRLRAHSGRMGKDDYISIAENGLFINDEIDHMSVADLNQFKAVVTQSSVNERAAYQMYAENRPRMASFCATGNNELFLTDTSGNRRWLPFIAEKIESPFKKPFFHAGIFAQAYFLYKNGYKYWFSKEEMEVLNAHNNDFEAPKPEHELIQAYFRKPKNDENGEFRTASEVIQVIGMGGLGYKLSANAVGRALTDLGYPYKRYANARGYYMVQLSTDEVIARRKRLAIEIQSDTNDQ